jgi:DNA-binding CsgD family transcriptional regulator
MKYRTRTYYTDAQKALMWERWKQGWTLHQIAHLFHRAHTSVQGILSRTGGIRPPARARRTTELTLAEREEISRAMAEGQSIRSIAARLGRAPSTVSRELGRNGGREAYRMSMQQRRGARQAKCAGTVTRCPALEMRRVADRQASRYCVRSGECAVHGATYKHRHGSDVQDWPQIRRQRYMRVGARAGVRALSRHMVFAAAQFPLSHFV